jgi:hypothetical protein
VFLAMLVKQLELHVLEDLALFQILHELIVFHDHLKNIELMR